ncbi:hypothetical protein DSO57_1035280 [Entomophthora muscae]|uniref:Uncharacterized protein n=1 Tax=Entomophthora muscae TaxID=34485 RepID=A0ACC2S1U9_9FUNG|nr:hypothetical protein DSO57_1035280 [Entomophthora muscae]
MAVFRLIYCGQSYYIDFAHKPTLQDFHIKIIECLGISPGTHEKIEIIFDNRFGTYFKITQPFELGYLYDLSINYHEFDNFEFRVILGSEMSYPPKAQRDRIPYEDEFRKRARCSC